MIYVFFTNAAHLKIDQHVCFYKVKKEWKGFYQKKGMEG